MTKKRPENNWKCHAKRLTFAAASREKQVLKQQKQGLENFWKIFKKKICRFGKSPYLCTRFGWKTGASDTKKGSDKILKKSSKKIWNFGNKFLPLQPESTARPIRKKVLKNFWKNLSKRFGGSKNNTYLCTTFRWKTAVGTKAKIERSDPPKRKKLFL